MLVLKDITVTVTDENHREKTILDKINFEVKSDKFFVITGPNGGGKSTLAKVMMGIMPPSSGQIFFNGKDITHKNVTERANMGIGFAFQQPVRFKGLTVSDLISLASGKKLNVDEICAYLSEVGICAKDYISRELNSTLSGGEMKRVEIAMLMARQSSLSIFDEPEAGIDLWSYQNLINVFYRIKQNKKGTAIIISHQERILEIADEIAVINHGKLLQLGPKEDVLPSLRQSTPPCNMILERVS